MPARLTPMRVCSCLTAVLIASCALTACAPSLSPETQQMVSVAAGAAGVEASEIAAVIEGQAVTQSEVDARIDRFYTSHGYLDTASVNSFLETNGYTADDVRAKVLHQLVDEMLIIKEAERLDIQVPDEVVEQSIRSISSRYPTTDSWVDALGNSGYDEQSYEEAVRNSLLMYALRDAVIPDPEPTEDQIAQYTVVLAPTLVGRRSSHILFSANDRGLAEKVHGMLLTGEDFDEMARTYSIDGTASIGGDMGWDSIETFAPVYQEALDALDVGEISPVVRSAFGYHIIKCTDRYDAPTNPDGSIDIAAIPDDLLAYVKRSIASSLKDQLFNEYIDNLEAKASIVVFASDGAELDPAEVGLATEQVEIDYSGGPAASPDEHAILGLDDQDADHIEDPMPDPSPLVHAYDEGANP